MVVEAFAIPEILPCVNKEVSATMDAQNVSSAEQQSSPQDGNLGSAAIPQGAPQLPPQMFTTAAQLLDLTDSRSLFPNVISVYSFPLMGPGFTENAKHLLFVVQKNSC